MFAEADGDVDLGQDDQDALDKMAVDDEDGDIYNDGWVIDDDDEPGGVSAYKANPNGIVDDDGRGMREMGM